MHWGLAERVSGFKARTVSGFWWDWGLGMGSMQLVNLILSVRTRERKAPQCPMINDVTLDLVSLSTVHCQAWLFGHLAIWPSGLPVLPSPIHYYTTLLFY